MEEQRVAIEFCVKASKSVVETIELINMVCFSAAMTRANVYWWYAHGREDVKDDDRSGRSSTARTDENLESVRRLLTEGRRTTLQVIADRLNIGKESVRQVVTKDLGKESSARDLFLTTRPQSRNKNALFTARIFF